MNENRKAPKVFVGMPCGDGWTHVSSAASAMQRASATPIILGYEGGSCLMHTFNQLWTKGLLARESGVTHFAMIHADVEASPGWLDVLVEEQRQTGAVAVSAVVAIKDNKGLTSTAVGSPTDFYDYRRITVSELRKLPATFEMADVARLWGPELTDGKCLLINTGCFLVDIRHPMWDEAAEDGTLAFAFEQHSRIQRWPNGVYSPEFAPEDWLISRYIARHGRSCAATTKVVTAHHGVQVYPNNVVWGSDHDVEIDEFWAKRKAAYKPSESLIEDEGGSAVGAAEELVQQT